MAQMTLADVKAFQKEFGHKPILTHKETNDLPGLLLPDEKLLAVADGNLKYAHNKKEVGVGIIFATNKRVVFYRKSFIGTSTKEEFPLSKISAASLHQGIVLSSIFIRTSGDDVEITAMGKAIAQKTAAIISDLVNNHSTHQAQPIHAHSLGDEIKKLAELRDQGILTESEFAEQKQKLLNK